eukprot:gene45175-56254_t
MKKSLVLATLIAAAALAACGKKEEPAPAPAPAPAAAPATASTLDTRELRNVFGSFVTGVTVVTTLDPDGQYQGVTANSFSSVSLDPPLVLWSQATNARSFAAFRDADHFVVNILAEHQRDVSQRFAKTGSDKFEGVATRERMGGVPALEECCAWVECRKVAMYPGGDHVVYLGEVLAMERTARRPLAFAQGKYMLAYEHELNFTLEKSNSAHMAHNDAVRMASAALRLPATRGPRPLSLMMISSAPGRRSSDTSMRVALA